MTDSQVILAILVFVGVGSIEPDWVAAQHSGRKSVRTPPAEEALPADVREPKTYQFFPRAAQDKDSADTSSGIEQVSAGESSEPDAEPATDLESEAWDASEQFSPGRFRDTVPIQYPLDDSAYEGEDPLGRDPQDSEGDWLESSVHRPEETLPLEDQPWVRSEERRVGKEC